MKCNTCNCSVIAVDLDGTLTYTDTLHESVIALIRDKPLHLFKLPFWLIQGKAAFKDNVARNVNLDVTTFPYNQQLIEWLNENRSSGKKIVLCTAANERIANAVVDYLQLFDEVIASDSNNNVKSSTKRRVLEDRYGKKGYIYAGNSRADLEVWAGSAQAIVVNASDAVKDKAALISEVYKVFPQQPITNSQWLKVLRVHQWLKNALLFVPLLAAHQYENFQSVLTLILAFVSFSFCASAVYVANDLLDLESDRRHPRKRLRPFAVAATPIAIGTLMAPVLAIVSLLLGMMVGAKFVAWLTIYLVLTSAYSLSLKRYALIDCLTLAALYTMRIEAGAAAVAIPLSFWLLAFSVFIFLSLAFVKRYSELQVLAGIGNNHAHGRGYAVTDAPLIQTLGISAGYAAVLVLALYLNSETVASMYSQPELIWIAAPLILFWVSWVWLKAHRGEMHDDPIIFAIKDKASLFIVAIITTSFFIASK